MARSRAHDRFLHFYEFCMEKLQGNHSDDIRTWRMARQATRPEHSSTDPSERSLLAETTPKIEYAVSQTAKINREKPRESRSSAWLSIVKCLFGAFLFVSVLICLVASKLSLLSIAHYHGNASSGIERETLFIMIVVLLIIPEAYTLLKASWISLFSKTHKWPCRKAVFMGLFSSSLEVFGLCFFAIVVLLDLKIHPGLRIVMMNGVFVVPVLWQVFRSRGCQAQGSWRQCFIFILALTLEFAGIGMLTYKMYKERGDTPIWGVPLALILLSFAWCPEIFKYVTKEVRNPPNPSLNGLTTSQPSPNVELAGLSIPQGETILGVATRSKSARGKAAIITSLWKLFLIPFVAALYCYIFNRADLRELQKGFDNLSVDSDGFVHFMVQIWTSFLGYMLGILACAICMQLLAFAVPMILATPISVGLTLISNTWAEDHIFFFKHGDPSDVLLYVITGCFLLAQFFSVGYYVLKKQEGIMAKESSLFWMPTYNGLFLEQHLLLNRRNEITDDHHVKLGELVKNTCVYICTTMYHENEQEMEQLLNSLHDIDCAREKSRRQIESHIFFDGAIKGDVLNNYVLQLISLIPRALKVSIDVCMKLKTPYGMQMRWRLPGGMYFHIHLKDNLRVKNKKRWSQVMYMSYVLDFKEKLMEVTDENTYILTTDADVRFTHESVEALLDLMMRDPNVGAVCGRTHPLGVGPIVWYQIFDYAIGHWFQKVANHVLGSVLCSPGCFSVYRAAAIRDVLSIYSSKVDTSFDFLTKDMGEDRWLCTLMVQSGWRLDYCAAAEDSTFCPDNFDEFFKQRRRWIPSTLANLALVISQWKLTVTNNYISFAFILYQALMVFSTVISPSTVILIMMSGLQYAEFPISNQTALLVLLILTSVGYGLICLYTSQDFQLKTAFILTIVFALLMAYVTVGVAAQVGDDLYKRSHPPTPTPTSTTSPVTQPARSTVPSKKSTTASLFRSPLSADAWQDPLTPNPRLAGMLTNATTSTNPTTEVPGSLELPADVSTLYLAGLIGIFILAALLHLTEAYCLVHGLWYLLCLPSGYLLLIIYSICNLTDRSWGTREEKSKKVDDVPWYEKLWAKIRSICTCCGPQPAPQPAVTDRVDGPPTESETATSPEETSDSDSGLQGSGDNAAAPSVQEVSDNGSDGASASSLVHGKHVDELPPRSAMKQPIVRRTSTPRDGLKEDSGRLGKWRYPGDKKVTFAAKLPRMHPETLVEDWLQKEFQIYVQNFRDSGYDSVSFIVGMTDKHLKAIGIEKRGHRKRLLMEIEKLPQMDIPQEVPENVEDWLTDLGLDEYWTNFTQSGYTEPRMLEDLKIMNKETLKETFVINKPGHLDKLYKAIQKVQYPSEAQRRIRLTREETNKLHVMDLKVDNQDGGHEFFFWEGLRQLCLLPESAVFGAVEELKEKLEDLRNYTLMVFFIANMIWIILIITLMRQTRLEVLGTNVLGLAFLCIYGLIIVIQFLTLLWHRVETFFHVIARTPWRRGQLHMSWAFDDENLPPPPTDSDLDQVRRHARRPRRRRSRRSPNQASVSTDERESLLSDGRPPSSYGSKERDIPHLV